MYSQFHQTPLRLLSAPVAVFGAAISALPAAAALPAPIVAFPTTPVTTGERSFRVTGTGVIGTALVVFDDLNGDGTCQWLDNGGTGEDAFDSASGTISSLSG